MADFQTWNRDNLVQLAEHLMVENAMLHADRKMLLDRIREQIRSHLLTGDEALRSPLKSTG